MSFHSLSEHTCSNLYHLIRVFNYPIKYTGRFGFTFTVLPFVFCGSACFMFLLFPCLPFFFLAASSIFIILCPPVRLFVFLIDFVCSLGGCRRPHGVRVCLSTNISHHSGHFPKNSKTREASDFQVPPPRHSRYHFHSTCILSRRPYRWCARQSFTCRRPASCSSRLPAALPPAHAPSFPPSSSL